MQRCLELAQNGVGSVSPNPLVGCVIVYDNKIIGEGWHKQLGEAHAEVNAIDSVKDKSLLAESTLYVNLEPCNHFGKTPPCANLIIEHKIKKVVVGMVDPFEKVAGQGIKKLKDAGIDVEVGILEEDCKFLNRRFIKFVTQQKPYVILKWAQTWNGFIAPDANKISAEEFEIQRHITDRIVQKLVHKWRTEEDAIMVGTNTALLDNPALNAREWKGRNPARIVLDRNLRLPFNLKLFDKSEPTIVFTELKKESEHNLAFIQLNFEKNWLNEMLNELYKLNIQSVVIEGGSQLLNAVIDNKIWDEAIIFTSPKTINDGIKGPLIYGNKIQQENIDGVVMNVLLAIND
jgi:diaminohydroxyphosphoribosylaminopyrimidine deaminase / 5-amino-6-(5-phosphoribosylamino)uracil reductase